MDNYSPDPGSPGPGLSAPGIEREDRTPARVLVVDDEPSLAELLASVLRAEGGTVKTAGNGAGGVAARARVPTGRRGAGRHAPRFQRYSGHAPAPGRDTAGVRAVPDRAGRGGGPDSGHHRRRRRLRDQAVQPGGSAGPAARPAAPGQPDPRPH